MRSGKTSVEPLKHDKSVASVYVSRDNQQIISMDHIGKAYLWSVAKGELLESATDEPARARLLWKARNGWSGAEKAGA